MGNQEVRGRRGRPRVGLVGVRCVVSDLLRPQGTDAGPVSCQVAHWVAVQPRTRQVYRGCRPQRALAPGGLPVYPRDTCPTTPFRGMRHLAFGRGDPLSAVAQACGIICGSHRTHNTAITAALECLSPVFIIGCGTMAAAAGAADIAGWQPASWSLYKYLELNVSATGLRLVLLGGSGGCIAHITTGRFSGRADAALAFPGFPGWRCRQANCTPCMPPSVGFRREGDGAGRGGWVRAASASRR